METAILVLAAGRGERLGAGVPKAFVSLGGVPILLRSLAILETVPEVDSVIPVLGPEDRDRYESLPLGDFPKVGDPVVGGDLRQDSMAAGLASLPDSISWVGVHDAARCLVDAGDVGAVITAAQQTGAAILAQPVKDTIKQVADMRVVGTPERRGCWAAQTPQVFRREFLEKAVEFARAEGREATDDAELVEQMGVVVTVVESRFPNPKITFSEDLAWAEYRLGQEGD